MSHSNKDSTSSLQVTFPNGNGSKVTIAAVIYRPKEFDQSKKYPAVVIAHPGGGVKEQTAGLSQTPCRPRTAMMVEGFRHPHRQSMSCSLL